MAPTAEEIVRRYEELREGRGTWDSHFQEVSDYGLGRRDFGTTTIAKGRRKQSQIYDNTFMHAGSMLASGLHSLLSNPATRWFRLKLENDALMEIPSVALWLEIAESRLYSAFNRPAGGFNMAQHEAYVDIVNLGTGGTFIEDGGERGSLFMSAPLSGTYLGEDEYGRLDTFMWIRRMTARQIVQEFGRGKHEGADKSIDGQRYEEEWDILRAVFPRNDPMLKFGPRSLPWASYCVGIDKHEMLRESGYHECPFAMARWDKEPGEVYGRGPGIKALPATKVIQQQQKTLLKATQKAVDPPLLVPSGDVIQALQTQPGGTSVAKHAYMTGGKPPVFPLHWGSELPIGIEMLQMSRADIRAAFHWELLQLIQHTPGTTPPTATQVAEIADNQKRVVSPILGRIQDELLEKEVVRTFGIELRAGRIPPPPLVIQGQNWRIEYVSPAVRAQRNSDAAAVRRLMMTAAEFGQVDSAATRLLDTDEGMRVIAEAEGVPSAVIRSRDEVQQMLAAERKLAAEQAAKEDIAQAAATAGKVAPAMQAIQGGRAA